MLNKISRFQLIEILVPATVGTKVSLGQQPDLIGVTVQNVEVFTVITMATSPAGNTMAPLTELKKAVLSLMVNGAENIYRIPLLKLNNVNDFTSPYSPHPVGFDVKNVDWEKSYVQFASAVAGNPYSIVIGVTYTKDVM